MKLSKKLFALLSLVLVLAMLGGTVAAAEAGEALTVDEQLVGEWSCYDSEYNLYIDALSLIRSLELFLPDGTVTERSTFATANALGLPQLKAASADGELMIGDAFVAYLKTLSEAAPEAVNASYVEDAAKLANIKVSYEFFDLDE